MSELPQRHIKLKEWGRFVDVIRDPGAAYLSTTDGSIEAGAFRLRTNKDGFIIGSETSDAPSPIVILGDSVAECMFISEDHRLSCVVEKELASLGEIVPVLNGGVTGTTSLSLLNSFLNKVLPLKPRAIVVLCGVMDIDAAIVDESFWTNMPYVTAINDPAAEEAREMRPIDTSDRIKLLSVITHTAATFGVPIVFCTTPARDREDDFTKRTLNREHFEKFNRNIRAINASTREVALLAKIPLIDLDRLLVNKDRLVYDLFHFNKEGAKQAGSLIAKSLFPIIRRHAVGRKATRFSRLFAWS